MQALFPPLSLAVEVLPEHRRARSREECHTLECLGRSMKDSERRLPPDSGPRDRLLALGRGYFDFAVNSPLLFELVYAFSVR